MFEEIFCTESNSISINTQEGICVVVATMKA